MSGASQIISGCCKNKHKLNIYQKHPSMASGNILKISGNLNILVRGFN